MKKVFVFILAVVCFSSVSPAFSMQSTGADQSTYPDRLIANQNQPSDNMFLAQRDNDDPVPNPEMRQRRSPRAVDQGIPPQPERLEKNNQYPWLMRQEFEQREQRMNQWEQALRERNEKLERLEHRIDAMENRENEQRNYLQELAESLKHSVNQTIQDDKNQKMDYFNALKEKLERESFQLKERSNQLEEQERNIASQYEELNQGRSELEQQFSMLDEQRQQVNRQDEEIKRCQEELDKRNDHLRQREEELNQWSRNLEERQRQLEEKEREINQRLNQSDEERQREKDELRMWSEDIERREQQMNEREDHRDGLGPVGGIVLLLLFILWIWCLQDCLKRAAKDFPTDGRYDKVVWLITLICTLFIGAILYVFLVQGKSAKAE